MARMSDIYYSFIITSPAGVVLDFGMYYDGQCAWDTAQESPFREGNAVTIVRHDDDGGAHIGWTQDIKEGDELPCDCACHDPIGVTPCVCICPN